MLFAAVALVLAAGFTACSKEEAAPENIIKVEFAVADKAGFDTAARAVKTAWAEGDQIMVLFKPGKNWLISENSTQELLILKYTGSAWVVSNMPANTASLGSAGNYAAIHYRVPADKSCGIAGHYDISTYYFTNYAGGEVLSYMGDEAQYTLADGKLNLGTISLAMSEEAIQFSVKNLAAVEGEWYLALADQNWQAGSISDLFSPTYGFQAETPRFNTSNGNLGTGSRAWATPVVNGADRSFFFTADYDQWIDATKLIFVLENRATTPTATYKYEYKPVPFALPALKKAYLLPAIDSGKWVAK